MICVPVTIILQSVLNVSRTRCIPFSRSGLVERIAGRQCEITICVYKLVCNGYGRGYAAVRSSSRRNEVSSAISASKADVIRPSKPLMRRTISRRPGTRSPRVKRRGMCSLLLSPSSGQQTLAGVYESGDESFFSFCPSWRKNARVSGPGGVDSGRCHEIAEGTFPSRSATILSRRSGSGIKELPPL